MARSVRSKRTRANNAIKREKLKKHEARHLSAILDRLKQNLGVEENMITEPIQSEPKQKPQPQKQKVKVKITVEGQ